MKQTVTFQRVQTVTVEFDLEQPLTRDYATHWANWGFGGADALDQMMRDDWQGRRPVSMSVDRWQAYSADPVFAMPEPKPRKRRAHERKSIVEIRDE